MGLRRLCFLLSVTSVLWLVGCGDNLHPARDDAGDDGGGGKKDGAIDAPPDALMCTTPQIKCGDMCVNPTTDNNHCGDCNTVCNNGESCQTDGSSSKCCPTGQHNCGGVCVDETNDESHCGSCTTTCGNNQTCDNGTCCGAGTTVCTTSAGQQCFDLNTDENHCGSCTTMCANTETCTTTSSTTTPNPKCCTTGDNNCNGTCSDPKTDNSNCGSCGNACTGAGNACSDGKCCVAPQVSCDGTTCVSPTGNTTCGATAGNCGTNCSTQGKVCKQDGTQTTEICCTAGQNNCSGQCSNPLTDNNNCGSCGNMCTGGTTCSNGVCCGPGETGCGTGTASPVCVDLNTDDAHCGSCSTSCVGTTTPTCDGAQCAAACDTTTTPPATDCSGDCVFTGTDHDHCGNCTTKCAANQVCSAGVCTTSCPNGTTDCGGSCVNTATDPNHCGSCGGANSICNPGDECVAGVCQVNCDPGLILCGAGTPNANCVDPTNSNQFCSTDPNTCGTACAAGSTCEGGVCCTAPAVHPPAACGNATCVDPGADTTCGATTNTCGTNCTTTGKTCMTDGTTHICCATGEIDCNGVCVNTKTDPNNCGGCQPAAGDKCDTTSNEVCDNGLCCSTSLGQVNKNGVCCSSATNILGCNGACVDKLTDKNNCGSCGNACPGTEICVNGACATACLPNPPLNTDCGTCTDPQTDPFHCGDPACAWCTSGTCNSGMCQTCAQKDSTNPDQCGTGPGSVCTNLTNDEEHCGDCNTMCGTFETCTHQAGSTAGQPGYGKCCASNLPNNCSGTCVDFQVGAPGPSGTTLYCGDCATTCGAGSVCTAGVCKCPSGTTTCSDGSCKDTSSDPNNCGGCGIDGAQFKCSSSQACIAGECVTSCPAPLILCNGKCINPDDDSANCGGCVSQGSGVACGANNGCSAGACVPVLGPFTPINPNKCINGGPPISVPTDGAGGNPQCTGNIGQVSFNFGLCSRTNLGPLSQALTTDAFDSNAGAYKPSCTSGNPATCDSPHCSVSHIKCLASELNTVPSECTGSTATKPDTCLYPLQCVAGTCIAGGVGVNGTATPVASNTAATTVGGDFWVYGLNGVSNAVSAGLAVKGNTTVKRDFINLGSLDLTKTTHIYNNAYVTGAWSANGGADMTVDNQLYTTSTCNPLTNSILHYASGACHTSSYPNDPPYPFTTGQPPCGQLGNPPLDGSLLQIQALIPYYKNYAHNDNKNVTPEIPFNLLTGQTTTTRLDLPCGVYYFDSLQIGKDTTIVVHGHVAIVIGGAMRVSQKLILDLSDASATLDIFVGGVVNVSNIVELGSPAFPRRSRLWIGGASCLGTGTCSNDYECCSGVCSNGTCTAGGGNLSQAMSLSNGGYFNGLIWAGYGTFTHSNPLEMYGSIYTRYFDASGDTTIHYDKGATAAGDECPPPPPNAACESCRQCGNQPCINNKCGSPCTSNSQCCSPLQCNLATGVCQ